MIQLAVGRGTLPPRFPAYRRIRYGVVLLLSLFYRYYYVPVTTLVYTVGGHHAVKPECRVEVEVYDHLVVAVEPL